MNTKTWNDLVGVSRGLWSVIQKAQTSSVRIHKMPRVPTYERLDNYSQKYSEKIRTQNEESILNQELYDIKQERIIKNVENQKEEKLMYEVNESQLQKKTQKEPKIDSLSQEFTEKLVTEEPEKAKEEEYIEDEISLKEKDMGYHETPFYLKQDRPVFTGKETKIPTSPSARALHFGALGISLVGGTISAALKQNLGISRPLPEVVGRRRLARYAMTDDNSNRLSNTLCKMRGAALKIGQILSNTEDSVIPPSMQRAFDKARQNADIMPKYQVIQMLERELGQDWESNFKEFNMYPIAAASIGQVHEGVLQDGTKVAIKIQYPNIARSIDSDFSNFKRLLKVLGAAPDSLYIDELFTNVKTELHEECDYIVEAEKQEYYKKMLDCENYTNDYYVPKVYDNLSTKHILTQEFINGLPIDELHNCPQTIRDRAGELLLKLCLHEIFLLKFMQTDPNPANFYYDLEENRFNLIDLGAAHHYKESFVHDYFQIVEGAVLGDKDKIIDYSKKLGFLTGEENRVMLESHSNSAMFIGEPFKHQDAFFDFGNSEISRKLIEEIPVMLRNRLSPPPQEVYSLHRKLSGAYFLCIKLKSRVNSRELFSEVSEKYKLANNSFNTPAH
ncbi:unnamed protein product [Moneuplotes crassus]|uniref:ABC1 atypical kinase-like domain-containing protein n=1 Tax=Euplotes crassus TaxID=5936 RepID=A0AAD1X840_EUPCR|nr:unnamed protein product [Moneuplotes crassus]